MRVWEEHELTAQSEDVKRVRESYDAFLTQTIDYNKAMNLPLLQGRA